MRPTNTNHTLQWGEDLTKYLRIWGLSENLDGMNQYLDLTYGIISPWEQQAGEGRLYVLTLECSNELIPPPRSDGDHHRVTWAQPRRAWASSWEEFPFGKSHPAQDLICVGILPSMCFVRKLSWSYSETIHPSCGDMLRLQVPGSHLQRFCPRSSGSGPGNLHLNPRLPAHITLIQRSLQIARGKHR